MHQQLDTLYALATTISASIAQLRQKLEYSPEPSPEEITTYRDAVEKIETDFSAFRSLSVVLPPSTQLETLQNLLEQQRKELEEIRSLLGEAPQVRESETEIEEDVQAQEEDAPEETPEEDPILSSQNPPPEVRRKRKKKQPSPIQNSPSLPQNFSQIPHNTVHLTDEEKKIIGMRIGITSTTAVLMQDDELLISARRYEEMRSQNAQSSSATKPHTPFMPLEQIIRPPESQRKPQQPMQSPYPDDPTRIHLPKIKSDKGKYGKVFTLAGVGGMSYQAISSAIHRAESKIDHDTVRGITTAHYYTSTAYGFAKAVLPQNPAGRLELDALRTPKQTTVNTRQLLARKKVLLAQIHADGKIPVVAAGLSGKQQKDRLSALTAARVELESIEKQLQGNQRIHLSNHQQQLQQKMLTSLMPNGKVPSSAKRVEELAYTHIQKQQKQAQKKYGSLIRQTPKDLTAERQRLMALAADNKKQIRALKAKPYLTPAEQKKLSLLIANNHKIGKNIGKLTGAGNAISDMKYTQEQLNIVIRNAARRKNRIISAAFLARSLMLRPLYSGDNTEGLAYVIQYGTTPSTYRRIRRVGAVPAKLSGKVLKRVAPEISNHAYMAVSNTKKTIHSAKKAVRRSIYHGKRNVLARIPEEIQEPVKTAVRYTAQGKSRLIGIQKGILKRKQLVKKWVSNTKIGHLISKTSHAGAAVSKAAGAVSAVGLKALAIAVIAWCSVGIITVASTAIIGGLGSSLILSPEASEGGKIDLSPHTALIRMEMSRFNSALADVMDKYENDEAYDNVEMTYSGAANNMREMLSMMAVRMNQDLDINTNSKVRDYISYLYKASHKYSVRERKYTCTGCKEKVVQKLTIDPVTHRPTLTQVKEIYCAGHIDVSILVSTLSFDDIFAADTFDCGDDWEGWNETNITWCKTIYEMDWSELYDGLNITGEANIGGVQSTAQERHIWDFLLEMTGNEYGAAGLMGNLYAESGLDPTNMEDQYEALIGHNDASYTTAVDNGSYPNFPYDEVGYGIAQWTYRTRKAGLLQLAKSLGTSVGNLDTQLSFLRRELDGGSILRDLSNASSVREASDIVMIRFENPKDQSERAKAARESLCQYFYNKMTLGVNAEGDLTEAQIRVIQIASNSASHGIDATGGYCQRWAAMVYAKAGFPIDNSCCAFHSGQRYGVSDDWSMTPPGAAVYGYSGSKYGHVGIYVGNGLVYHNVGGVAVDTLDDWVRKYRGFAWGWEAGTDLTQEE